MPTDPPPRLKGNPFARLNYFSTDVSKGVTRTPTGQRICALPGDFLLGFRDATIYECGKAHRRVMKATGRRWGVEFAKRLDRELSAYYDTPFRQLPPAVVHTCLADAFSYHGYGKLVVRPVDADAGVFEVELRHPVMPTLVPQADRPIDQIMAGMIGSLFAHLTGWQLDAVQTDCPAVGADAARFVVGPAEAVAAAEKWADAADRPPAHDAVLRRVRFGESASSAEPAEPAAQSLIDTPAPAAV